MMGQREWWQERSSGQLSAPWPGLSHHRWCFSVNIQHSGSPSACFPITLGPVLGPRAKARGLAWNKAHRSQTQSSVQTRE